METKRNFFFFFNKIKALTVVKVATSATEYEIEEKEN